MSRCINNTSARAHHCTPITFEVDKDSILNSKAEMKNSRASFKMKWLDFYWNEFVF